MELVLWANNLVRDDEKATVMQRAVVVQGRRRAALRSYRVCGVLVLSQGSVVVCVVRPRPTRRARVLPIDVTAPIDNGSVPPAKPREDVTILAIRYDPPSIISRHGRNVLKCMCYTCK